MVSHSPFLCWWVGEINWEILDELLSVQVEKHSSKETVKYSSEEKDDAILLNRKETYLIKIVGS